MLKFFAAGGAVLALAGCGGRGFSGLTTLPSVPQIVGGATAGASNVSAFQPQPNRRVKLDVPIGLAVNKHGDLYVGNAGESNILVYNSKRRLVKSATITKGIKDPAGLAFDKHGDLYVVNVISKEVTVYSPKGKRIPDKTIKLHMGADLEPSGIAIAKNGDVWVAGRDGHDYSLGEIEVFNSSHKLIHRLTQNLTYPLGIAFFKGMVFVCNGTTVSDSLSVFTPNGTFVKSISTPGFTPTYAAEDKKKEALYLTNGLSNNLAIISSTGAFTMKTLKGLDDAYGIAFTKSGDFYVANVAISTVTEYSGNGKLIHTIK